MTLAPGIAVVQTGMDGAAVGVPEKPDSRLPEGALHGAALIEGLMTWNAAVDAVAAAALQRDPAASFESCAAEFGTALGQFKDMLGGEEVTLFCSKKIIRRCWEYPNKVWTRTLA